MELPGHLGLALLVYAPVAANALRRGRAPLALLGLVGVLALSTAPDVDLYLPAVAHRGVTHTVWAVLAVGAIAAIVASRIGPIGVDGRGRARFGALVGGSAILSHLLGDAVTPMGIRPFLPLEETTYTLSLVYSSDPAANAGLLVAGVVVFAAAVSAAGTPRPAGAPARLFRRLRRT